jgi:hypothetical protein
MSSYILRKASTYELQGVILGEKPALNLSPVACATRLLEIMKIERGHRAETAEMLLFEIYKKNPGEHSVGATYIVKKCLEKEAKTNPKLAKKLEEIR